MTSRVAETVPQVQVLSRGFIQYRDYLILPQCSVCKVELAHQPAYSSSASRHGLMPGRPPMSSEERTACPGLHFKETLGTVKWSWCCSGQGDHSLVRVNFETGRRVSPFSFLCKCCALSFRLYFNSFHGLLLGTHGHLWAPSGSILSKDVERCRKQEQNHKNGWTAPVESPDGLGSGVIRDDML